MEDIHAEQRRTITLMLTEEEYNVCVRLAALRRRLQPGTECTSGWVAHTLLSRGIGQLTHGQPARSYKTQDLYRQVWAMPVHDICCITGCQELATHATFCAAHLPF